MTLSPATLRTKERCPVCDRPALMTWSDTVGGESVCRGGHDEPKSAAPAHSPGARVVAPGGGR